MDNLCELSDEELDQSVDHFNGINDEISVQTSAKPMASSGGPALTTSSCLSTSPLQSPNTSKSLQPQQAIRSELRRDFLRLLSSLHKRKVNLKLYECPLVLSATFDGCDHTFTQLFLSSFKTPIGLEKTAIVRTNDVIELEFPFHENNDSFK